ncbi:hypothetical protein HZH68_016346 [Vespula germanica]|uniref:Uncharacterized protein n=1 Tax=Vespula germanica TaxID=30212 RepID=A0A834J1I9_VESGE|nr:hypothetical protein HZH68_016346 [Vespula germanica]
MGFAYLARALVSELQVYHGLFSQHSEFVPRVNTRSIIEWDKPLIICHLLMPMEISKLGPRTSEHERSYGKAKMLLIGIGNFEHEKVGRSSLMKTSVVWTTTTK